MEEMKMKTPAEAIRTFNRVRQPEVDQLRANLCQAISDLPDNPDIRRLGDGVFAIKSDVLNDNWSPQFHDWKGQYKAIVDTLESVPFGQLLERLQEIVDDKAVGVGSRRRKLHPGVIKNLQQVIE